MIYWLLIVVAGGTMRRGAVFCCVGDAIMPDEFLHTPNRRKQLDIEGLLHKSL